MARLQARAGSPGCNRLWCRNDLIVIAALLLGDSLLTFLIVCKVPYTKIDWDAYMAQVSGFLGGERNYLNLKGDTGPLVYPAGFLYIYSAIKYLTGGEVFPAQIIFGILYIVNLSIIMAVYYRTKVLPWWALCFLCLSRRMHSIFMLRLFNDCIATTLAHLAIFLFQNHRWKFGMVIFSVAVSVKMNVLLYAPSLLLLLLEELTVFDTIATLFIAAFVQLVLGMPFLLSYPLQYMMKAFDLGRVFLYTWSVNFKFIPEEIFISKRFALALLIIHLGLLFLFAEFKWTKQQGGLIKAMKSRLKKLCKDSQKQTGRLDPKCKNGSLRINATCLKLRDGLSNALTGLTLTTQGKISGTNEVNKVKIACNEWSLSCLHVWLVQWNVAMMSLALEHKALLFLLM